MKLKLFSVLALSGLIAAGVACGNSSDDETGDGGSGGSGGSGSGTTKTSTTKTNSSASTGTPTTTGSPTSTTGSAGCDTGVPGDIANGDQICIDCVYCSQENECNAEWTAYATDADYDAYVACAMACPDGDTACFDACDAQYPETAELYVTAISCSVCGACQTNCNAADNCM